MSLGIPEPRMSLRDRVLRGQGRGMASRPAPEYPVDAGRQIDSGGLSAAGFGTSSLAQMGELGQSPEMAGQPAMRLTGNVPNVDIGSANGANNFGARRLIQRISPVGSLRGGPKKEYEGGGP